LCSLPLKHARDSVEKVVTILERELAGDLDPSVRDFKKQQLRNFRAALYVAKQELKDAAN